MYCYCVLRAILSALPGLTPFGVPTALRGLFRCVYELRHDTWPQKVNSFGGGGGLGGGPNPHWALWYDRLVADITYPISPNLPICWRDKLRQGEVERFALGHQFQSPIWLTWCILFISGCLLCHTSTTPPALDWEHHQTLLSSLCWGWERGKLEGGLQVHLISSWPQDWEPQGHTSPRLTLGYLSKQQV